MITVPENKEDVRKLLYQQMAMLSEKSKETVAFEGLIVLSNTMTNIAEVLLR